MAMLLIMEMECMLSDGLAWLGLDDDRDEMCFSVIRDGIFIIQKTKKMFLMERSCFCRLYEYMI